MDRFRGLPREFWVLFAGTAVNRLGGVVEPFLALYFAHRGLGIAAIGALTAVAGAGSLTGQLVGGVVADRVGRREAVALGMGGAAFSFALLGAAQATWLLVVGGFLAGMFLDFYRPGAFALLSDILEGEDRTRAQGLLFWVINIGFAVAAASAGALAEAGFSLLFAVDAVTCLAFAAILWFGIRRDTRPPGHAEKTGGLADVLRDRSMVLFCGISLLMGTVLLQAFSTLALAMREDGLGPGTYGLVIALNGVAIGVLQPLMLPRLARRDPLSVFALGTLILGLGWGATGLTETAAAYAIPVVVWTVGEIMCNTVAPGIVADLAPPHLRGRYQGLWGMSFSLALILAPLGGGLVLATAGDRVLWSASALVCGVAALAALALRPRLRATAT